MAKSGTPLMEQYKRMKSKYPDAILLFRVGDFYETFSQDAITASKVLDIVLTKRANGAASHIELAGFPHHALEAHLPKLVKAGYRVAICDQLEDPKLAKGLVKRGITELVTPGLSLYNHALESKSNNYLASLFFAKEGWGIAFLDLSTGEFSVTQGNESQIKNLLSGFQPSEIIVHKKQKKEYENLIGTDKYSIFTLEDWVYTFDYASDRIKGHFNIATLKGFGLDKTPYATIAAGAVFYYLELTEHHNIQHISNITRIEESKYVWLDSFTSLSLELVRPQSADGVSFV